MKTEFMNKVKANKRLISLISFVVMAIIVNLISIFALNVSVVPVCCLIILEAGLAVCMHKAEIWVHGFLLLAQIIAGILTGNIILMVMCVIMYALALISLEFSFDLGEI